jgi:predicted phosphate transport protein (TIGR00153 family)
MVRLIPREEKYFSLLCGLIAKIRSGATLFVDLLADYDNRAGFAEQIKAIEEECDHLVADIVGKLNTSFITPIDREDIYLLTTRADDIIDEINGLARRLEIVHAFPLRPDVPEIAGILADALVEVEAAFGRLQSHDGVTEHNRAVRRLEKRADVLYAEALHRLFTEEPNAIEVVKWVTIYEQLEDAIDRCKHLAESLESVVVKHS